jgi:hypothetical protein
MLTGPEAWAVVRTAGKHARASSFKNENTIAGAAEILSLGALRGAETSNMRARVTETRALLLPNRGESALPPRKRLEGTLAQPRSACASPHG